MDTEKNIYGLSEGVFKVCQFLGLKFPPEVVNKPQPVPSDYFGDDFELGESMIAKLCAERKWAKEHFEKIYQGFSTKFNSQKCFPKLCNDPCFMGLEKDKYKANKLFASFLHRDWINTRNCTFEEFKTFIQKHTRFFSKPVTSSGGAGAQIISVDPNDNLEKIFIDFRNSNRNLEELVVQHEEISSFCPDTVNTIRVNIFLDIHNVVHILTTSGRFGRIGGVVDNAARGGNCFVSIGPETGVIISDGISKAHELMQQHPDTGKIFKGFQYPCWKKLRTTVTKMAKMIPQLRHIAWDIAINVNNEVVLIEINGRVPYVALQQAADSVGKRHLYTPLVKELKNYKWKQMQLLGYKINILPDFDSAYNTPLRNDLRLKLAIDKMLPECKSLIDLGCRKEKFVKSITPPHTHTYQNVIPSTIKIMMMKKLSPVILMTANFLQSKRTPVFVRLPPNMSSRSRNFWLACVMPLKNKF